MTYWSPVNAGVHGSTEQGPRRGGGQSVAVLADHDVRARGRGRPLRVGRRGLLRGRPGQESEADDGRDTDRHDDGVALDGSPEIGARKRRLDITGRPDDPDI
ncbi:hypothetical protein GCM10023168_35730 [Fodinibacter luteus]|uniref:Uncharacterized protein n=1 Tax=Fodinibacter luteus TaxID=552064 RepID=A0ABP8KRR1_9MICO